MHAVNPEPSGCSKPSVLTLDDTGFIACMDWLPYSANTFETSEIGQPPYKGQNDLKA